MEGSYSVSASPIDPGMATDGFAGPRSPGGVPRAPTTVTMDATSGRRGEIDQAVRALEQAAGSGGSPRRRKAYLVATYTGTLVAEDLREKWFVYDEQDSEHTELAAELQGTAEVIPLRDRTVGVGASEEEEWEAAFAIRQGFHTATTTGTDATVHIEMVGTLGSSGVHSLNAYTPREERDGIFRAGSIDEFAISCTDLGDIYQLRIWHDNDGSDLQSSRWKLDKVVVTCIQSSTASHASGKGDFAHDTKKTSDSDQWHFVPQAHWLGCSPTDVTSYDTHIIEVEEQIRLKMAEITELRSEQDRWRTEKHTIISGKTQECPHTQAIIRLENAPSQPESVSSTTTGEPEPDTREVPPVRRRRRGSIFTYGCTIMVVLLLLWFGLFTGSGDDSGDGEDSGGDAFEESFRDPEEGTLVAGVVDEPSPPPPPVCWPALYEGSEAECDCDAWASEQATDAALLDVCQTAPMAWTGDDVVEERLLAGLTAADDHRRCTPCCRDGIYPPAPDGSGLLGTDNGDDSLSWLSFGWISSVVVLILACIGALLCVRVRTSLGADGASFYDGGSFSSFRRGGVGGRSVNTSSSSNRTGRRSVGKGSKGRGLKLRPATTGRGGRLGSPGRGGKGRRAGSPGRRGRGFDSVSRDSTVAIC